MIKSLLPIFFLLVAAVTTTPGQESSVPGTVSLPDAVMRQVVNRVLVWYIKPSPRTRTLPVSERGVKSEWLPSIANVNLELVSDNDALKSKSSVFLFDDLQLSAGRYSINVGWSDLACRGGGDVWKFTVGQNGRVRLWRAKGEGWNNVCFDPGPPKISGLDVGEVSPNELRGYEFFRKGRLKSIRLGVSTIEDMRAIFGDTCESACAYDENWQLWAEYYEDRAEFTRSVTESGKTTEETEFIPRPEFVGKLQSVRLSPKKSVSFLNRTFPKTFGKSERNSIGDAWDLNGFAGAVHTTWTLFTDGYGLEYSVYGAETFNNLRDKTPPKTDPLRGGDLGSIEYSLPDSLNDRIFNRRPKPSTEGH